MLCETVRALQQVPQNFDGARAYESLFSPLIALTSFTSDNAAQ